MVYSAADAVPMDSSKPATAETKTDRIFIVFSSGQLATLYRYLRTDARQARLGQCSGQRFVRHTASDNLANLNEFFHINTGVEALVFAQKHQVFEHDIASGARSKRAFSQPPQ